MQTKINIQSVVGKAVVFWLRWYRTIFFVSFFGICIWGGFLWYRSVHDFHWSPEQKQVYVDSRSHRTVFRQADFESVLRSLDDRDWLYRAEYVPVRDIFLKK